jgi:hypothetical protein
MSFKFYDICAKVPEVTEFWNSVYIFVADNLYFSRKVLQNSHITSFCNVCTCMVSTLNHWVHLCDVTLGNETKD